MVRENADAGHLDLLGGSCLLLTRIALGTSDDDRRLLAPCVASLSTMLADLAEQPDDRATRQVAVDRSLEILREMRSVRTEPDPDLTAALTAARIAVTDLMLFAGVDPDEARAATREQERKPQDLEVPARPSPQEPPPLALTLVALTRAALPYPPRDRHVYRCTGPPGSPSRRFARVQRGV